ncbi:MAG: phosphotransferase [Candidatus Heimdallarchaeota archaeon]|nr:phosphotransferase [Candidatus Heimdallarchaeota archaeon]
MFLPYKSLMNVTPEQITTIFLKHFPSEEIKAISEIQQSFVNPVYHVMLSNHEEFILKINNPCWPNKSLREVIALSLVKEKTTIPTPELVAFDFIKEAVPWKYLIQKKVAGQELREAIRLGKMEYTTFLEIIQAIGRYLGELHSISFNVFGDFSISSPRFSSQGASPGVFWGKQFDDWCSCFQAFCLDNLNWVDQSSFPNYRPALRKKIQEFSRAFPRTEKSCFVHSDLQPTNILVEDGKIAAIIDWEWSFAGSPSFDFTLTQAGIYYSAFPSISGSKMYDQFPSLSREQFNQALLAGYQSTNKFDLVPQPTELAEFIWLLFLIGSWDWCVQASSAETVKELKQNVHELYQKIIT